MSATVSVLKLHANKREMTFLVPLYITGLVAIVSVLISFLFLRAGSVPGTEGWIEGSRNNQGMLWSLTGFLVYMGVQSIATTFPFALTLGATRKAFVSGTLLWSVATSAYLAAVFAILLTIEKATGHWFAGYYIFDVYVLGAGELSKLIPIVFLGSLFAFTVGGVFGAIWLRLGSRGPVLLAVAIALVLVLALVIILPQGKQIMAAFQLWWLAVAAVTVIVVSALGSWSLLRSAIVR
jgi:hypothetical protein